MLNFCCVMINVNPFSIKSSVKKFLLNVKCDVESVCGGGTVQRAGYGWPQGGDWMKTGQALTNHLGCRKNADPPTFLVLLVRLRRDPEGNNGQEFFSSSWEGSIEVKTQPTTFQRE